jgi:hypothetical protein
MELMIDKLTQDLREAAKSLTANEAAILVKTYYSVQEARIKNSNQGKALTKAELPHNLADWLTGNFDKLETYTAKLLDHYSAEHPAGAWARRQMGIGPVIAAALIANIDCNIAHTAGAVWRFCGLVPGQKKTKGQKIDWSPDMKRIAYFIGESFCKVSGKEKAYYGQVYKKRKELETRKNENLDYADQAKVLFDSGKFKDTKEAQGHLAVGRLPPFLIDKRAKRYAAKLFLAHFFEVLYEHTHNRKPPLPYPIAHLGHVHRLEVPHGDC